MARRSSPCSFRFSLCILAFVGGALIATLAPAQERSRPEASKENQRQRAQELAAVKSYPLRKWEDAYRFENKQYIVLTDTSQETADYIGLLMSFAQDSYRGIFNYQEPIDVMHINAYRNWQEYESALLAVNIPRAILERTRGMFVTHQGASTIFLPYLGTNTGTRYGKGESIQPTTVLLHEGTHQFIAAAIDFHIPDSVRAYIVGGPRTLSSVPLWLNEGLATYMECSYYDGEKLVVGEINQGRLRELQYEIRQKQSVSLKDLFRTQQDKFTDKHYAAAWGIVYWFLNDRDPKRRQYKREIFDEYLQNCRKGFMNAPDTEFAEKFLRGKMDFKKYVQEESYSTFLKLTLGERPTDDQWGKWETTWQTWILALDPKDPYGGLENAGGGTRSYQYIP
jgi:hypothetical protein